MANLFVTMNWRLWVRGLIAAVINSAAGAGTMALVEPEHFNIHEGLPKLGTLMVALAISGALLYLKEHPLPEWDGIDTRREPRG